MIKKLYRKYLKKYKLFKILANFIYYKREFKLSLRDMFFNKSILYFWLGIKKEKMPLPFYIQLEPTTSCNLNCLFCSRKYLPNERRNLSIDLELIKKIFEENKNIKVVKLQGLGEPTLTKNLEELLIFLKSKKVYILTIINGTTLLNDKIRKILLNYIDEIIISVDSIVPENYEKIRKGAKFEKVIEGLKKLIEENKKYNKKIKVNYVFSHLNYKEIPEAYRFFKDLGINIIFTEIENWKTPEDKEFIKDHLFVLEERKIRKNIYKYLKFKKLDYDFYFLNKTYFRKGKCNWGFYMCFITTDGLITPCCIRMESIYAFGDLKKENFHNIWNNKKFIEFRKAHLKNEYYPLCEYCPD